MFCPSCAYTLQKLSVTTDSGGRFEVDHCGKCGGTWFDPYEINRIPYHEVIKLAKVTVLPHKQPLILRYPLCPRCHCLLENFHSESVPSFTRLQRCSNCLGIWASQKSLEEFKIRQETAITEIKTKHRVFPALSVVFVPALFISLLFFTTFITVNNLNEARENRTQAANLIGPVQVFTLSDTTVTLVFQTKAKVLSSISYGPTIFELSTQTISSNPTQSHSIRLSNLKPNTLYIYRITLTDEKARKFTTVEQSFVTGK